MTELLLYTSIRDYIYARIEFLTEHMLSKNLTLALTIVVALLTLWIMVQGYLIATGRSQEGLKGFVYSLGKNYIILLIALGIASSSTFAIRTLTNDLSDGISQIMTGDGDAGSKCLTKSTESFIGCKIDLNITATQSMMGLINSVDTADDPSVEATVQQMRWFAGVGGAGPGVVAGTMLIVYRIAMSLFIGFAPLFILSLMFKKTAPLFQKWLYYGLATIFSSVLLAVMADISMDLVSNISAALLTSDKATDLLMGERASGLMYSITQQLGLGLILSTLLIVVPPMAGMWFNGVMSSFTPYSAIDRWNNPQGQGTPPHMDGGVSRQANYNVQNKFEDTNVTPRTNNHFNSSSWTPGGTQPGGTTTDAMKQPSQPGKGNTPI